MNELIVKEIRAAFADTEYPGDDNITPRPPRCAGDDYDDAIRTFRGKTWQEMALDDAQGMEFSYHFLSDNAFLYYLPAYLTVIVTDYDRSNCIPDMLMRSLNDVHAVHAEMSEQARAKFMRLTVSQLTVLRQVIQFVHDQYGATYIWKEPEEALVAVDLLLEEAAK